MDPAPATPSTPPASSRKKRIIAVAGVIAIFAILSIGVNLVASKRWHHFKVHLDAAIAKAREATGARAPLAGALSAGNAWDDYAPAIDGIDKAVKAGGIQTQDFSQAVEDPVNKESAARLKAFLPKIAADLDRVRAGTRRERALYPTQWERGGEGDIPSLINTSRVANSLLFLARERAASGDRAGALDELGALMQFGTDLSSGPGLICTMMSCFVLRLGSDGLRDLVLDPATAAAELARIRTMTEVAERNVQDPATTIAVEFLLVKQTLRRIGDGKLKLSDAIRTQEALGGMADFGYTWRYYFSTRIMVVDAVRTLDAGAEEFRKGWAEDYKTAAARYEALNKAVRNGNPLSAMMMAGPGGADRAWREARAKLRIIRAAAMVRAGAGPSDPAWPADPFDFKPLRHKEEGGMVRIRSLWHDCAESAAGGWKPKPEEDLLLDLKK